MRTLLLSLLLVSCSSDSALPPDAPCGLAPCGPDAPVCIIDCPSLPSCASLGCDDARELVDPLCTLTGAQCFCVGDSPGPVLCTFP